MAEHESEATHCSLQGGVEQWQQVLDECLQWLLERGMGKERHGEGGREGWEVGVRGVHDRPLPSENVTAVTTGCGFTC